MLAGKPKIDIIYEVTQNYILDKNDAVHEAVSATWRGLQLL